MKKEQFKEKLYPIHKTFWNKAYKKLSSKMSTLMSSLKRRSIEANVKCTIDKTDIRKMFYDIYGKGCCYCDKRLKTLDDRKVFYADDEIGWFFEKVKEIQEALNEFRLR